MDFEKLRAPFPPERVSWRVGSTNKEKTTGMALAYVDARDVMDRLDDVCGPAGWQCSYPHANGKTVCAIGIKVGEEWVWKSDGAGDSDIEAEKGALSDAFKRAAVRWAIGRYLYDIDSPWVAIESFGKSHKIKDSERNKLLAALRGQKAPPLPETKAPPVEPRLIPKPKDGWYPITAKTFTTEFMSAAKALDKAARQKLYAMNEDTIKDLRGVSAAAADNLDTLFAGLQ